MDDKEEKTVIEKLVDTVKSVASDIATTASNAAQYAMESDAKKMEPNIEAVAKKTNEQVYMPTTDAAAMPLPLVPKKRPVAATVIIGKKKTKTASKKTAPKVAEKTGKKSEKKSAAKKSNKSKKSNQSSALGTRRAKKTRRVANKKRPTKAKR
jgi:hypothetical protein